MLYVKAGLLAVGILCAVYEVVMFTLAQREGTSRGNFSPPYLAQPITGLVIGFLCAGFIVLAGDDHSYTNALQILGRVIAYIPEIIVEIFKAIIDIFQGEFTLRDALGFAATLILIIVPLCVGYLFSGEDWGSGPVWGVILFTLTSCIAAFILAFVAAIVFAIIEFFVDGGTTSLAVILVFLLGAFGSTGGIVMIVFEEV